MIIPVSRFLIHLASAMSYPRFWRSQISLLSFFFLTPHSGQQDWLCHVLKIVMIFLSYMKADFRWETFKHFKDHDPGRLSGLVSILTASCSGTAQREYKVQSAQIMPHRIADGEVGRKDTGVMSWRWQHHPSLVKLLIQVREVVLHIRHLL